MRYWINEGAVVECTVGLFCRFVPILAIAEREKKRMSRVQISEVSMSIWYMNFQVVYIYMYICRSINNYIRRYVCTYVYGRTCVTQNINSTLHEVVVRTSLCQRVRSSSKKVLRYCSRGFPDWHRSLHI